MPTPKIEQKPVWFSNQACTIANASKGTTTSWYLQRLQQLKNALHAPHCSSAQDAHTDSLLCYYIYWRLQQTERQNRAGQTLCPYSAAYAKRGIYNQTRAQRRLPLDYESPACAYLKFTCWQRMLFVSLAQQAFDLPAKSRENVRELPCLY